MPVYSFEALTAEGETRKGVMEADSAKAARSLLRSQALVPLKVDAVGPQAAQGTGAVGPGGSHARRRVFNATKLGIWTRQLAGLVSSGLPLERARTSLSDEAELEGERHLVATLRATVPLSRTMREEIDGLRQWAASRARPASLPGGTPSAPAGAFTRKVELS